MQPRSTAFCRSTGTPERRILSRTYLSTTQPANAAKMISPMTRRKNSDAWLQLF